MFTANKALLSLRNTAMSVVSSLLDTYQLSIDSQYNNNTTFIKGHSKVPLVVDIIDSKVILSVVGNVASDKLNQVVLGLKYRDFDGMKYNNREAEITPLINKKARAYFGTLSPLVTTTYEHNQSIGGSITYAFDITTLNEDLLKHVSEAIHLMNILPRVTQTVEVAI